MRIGVGVVVVPLALGLLSACSGQPDGNDGDCGGRVRFHGVLYVSDNRLNQAAPRAQTLGPGDLVDCDGHTVVDHVLVSAVKETDSRIAIRVGSGPWHGLYVAADLRPAEWPETLRRH